jgi:hypothetical protein
MRGRVVSDMKKMSDSELVNFVVRNMSFPNGVNSQITDSVTQALSIVLTHDDVWSEMESRRSEFKKRSQ